MTNWQQNGSRVPGVSRTFREDELSVVVRSAVSVATRQTAAEVRNLLSGKQDSLSRPARIEMDGLISGFASAWP